MGKYLDRRSPLRPVCLFYSRPVIATNEIVFILWLFFDNSAHRLDSNRCALTRRTGGERTELQWNGRRAEVKLPVSAEPFLFVVGTPFRQTARAAGQLGNDTSRQRPDSFLTFAVSLLHSTRLSPVALLSDRRSDFHAAETPSARFRGSADTRTARRSRTRRADGWIGSRGSLSQGGTTTRKPSYRSLAFFQVTVQFSCTNHNVSRALTLCSLPDFVRFSV